MLHYPAARMVCAFLVGTEHRTPFWLVDLDGVVPDVTAEKCALAGRLDLDRHVANTMTGSRVKKDSGQTFSAVLRDLLSESSVDYGQNAILQYHPALFSGWSSEELTFYRWQKITRIAEGGYPFSAFESGVP